MANKGGSHIYDKFTGTNNISDPAQAAKSEVVDGENIDIDNDRNLTRRPGKTEVIPGDFKNLDGFDEFWLYTDGSVLKKLTRTDAGVFSSSAVTTGHQVGNDMAYCLLLDNVYFSDGNIKGRLLDGSYLPWGTPVADSPSISAISGNMAKGFYQVAVTYVLNGLEGGARESSCIELNNNSALSIQLKAGIADSIRVYVSPPNGDTLYYFNTFTNSDQTITITKNNGAIPLETQHLQEPPLGNHISSSDGFLGVANGSYAFISKSLRYHLFDLEKDVFPFPEEITMFVGVDGGWLIGSDKIYFIANDPEMPGLRTLIKDRPLKGAYKKINGNLIGKGNTESWVVFQGHNGIYLVGPNGSIENLTKDKFATGSASFGSIELRAQNGMVHAVGIHRPKTSSNARVSDVVTATLNKNGVNNE